jgi:hypothetical protein
MTVAFGMGRIASSFLTGGEPKWPETGLFNLAAVNSFEGQCGRGGGCRRRPADHGFFPPNEKVFQLTVRMVHVMQILWYAFERNCFERVPQDDKVTEHQKMITEIEMKYGEADKSQRSGSSAPART